MKKILFIAALVLLLVKAQADAQTFKAVVKDAKTNAELAYVNVGIVGKAIGTVTDSTGHFSISINNNSSDTLKISMIGYVPKIYLVKDFIAGYLPGEVITLTPLSRVLAEVKIVGKKLKMAVLGNTTQSQSTDAGFTSNKLGNEIAR